jgi:hypothetical protein
MIMSSSTPQDLAAGTALADAALVAEHARVRLAEPAIACAARARQTSQRRDRRRHRLEIDTWPGS